MCLGLYTVTASPLGPFYTHMDGAHIFAPHSNYPRGHDLSTSHMTVHDFAKVRC